MTGLSQTWLASANVPYGYAVGACAALSPNGQLYFFWNARKLISTIQFPYLGLWGMCGFAPWLPSFPLRGRMIFPP